MVALRLRPEQCLHLPEFGRIGLGEIPRLRIVPVEIEELPGPLAGIDRTIPTWISHAEGLDIGRDTLTPVSDDYTIASSRFTGSLKQVVITLK